MIEAIHQLPGNSVYWTKKVMRPQQLVRFAIFRNRLPDFLEGHRFGKKNRRL